MGGATERRPGKDQRLQNDITGSLQQGPAIPSFCADPVEGGSAVLQSHGPGLAQRARPWRAERTTPKPR
eukprot:2438659-Karenia_brevis.AAC.1